MCQSIKNLTFLLAAVFYKPDVPKWIEVVYDWEYENIQNGGENYLEKLIPKYQLFCHGLHTNLSTKELRTLDSYTERKGVKLGDFSSHHRQMLVVEKCGSATHLESVQVLPQDGALGRRRSVQRLMLEGV